MATEEGDDEEGHDVYGNPVEYVAAAVVISTGEAIIHGVDQAVILQIQESPIGNAADRGNEIGSPLIENNASTNDGKDVSDDEETLYSPRQVNQEGDQEDIHDVLEEGEFLNILDPVEKRDIYEGDEIGNANEVVDEIIRGDEKAYPFFELDEEDDAQQEGDNDHTGDHQHPELPYSILP